MARRYEGRAEGQSSVSTYAKIIGIALLLTGVVGLLLGDERLFGLLNIDLAEDIVHLATGALLVYAGFAASEGTARSIVGGLGVIYLLVGVLGFITPTVFGLMPHGYTIADNLLHLVLGGLGIAFGWFLSR